MKVLYWVTKFFVFISVVALPCKMFEVYRQVVYYFFYSSSVFTLFFMIKID